MPFLLVLSKRHNTISVLQCRIKIAEYKEILKIIVMYYFDIKNSDISKSMKYKAFGSLRWFWKSCTFFRILLYLYIILLVNSFCNQSTFQYLSVCLRFLFKDTFYDFEIGSKGSIQINQVVVYPRNLFLVTFRIYYQMIYKYYYFFNCLISSQKYP